MLITIYYDYIYPLTVSLLIPGILQVQVDALKYSIIRLNSVALLSAKISCFVFVANLALYVYI